MRLLFDQNISFRIIKRLQSYFPDCLHVSDCNLSNKSDSRIWEYAKNKDLAIVTFDSDFFDISIVNGHPPKIIWIRAGNLSTDEISDLLISNKATIEKFLHDPDCKDLACLELDN